MAPPSHCHSDFAAAIDCSYEQVAGLQPATPQKVADCLASIRNDLLKIIPKWEQSGQGEGGSNNELDKTFDNHDEHEDADTSISSNSRQQPEHQLGFEPSCYYGLHEPSPRLCSIAVKKFLPWR